MRNIDAGHLQVWVDEADRVVEFAVVDSADEALVFQDGKLLHYQHWDRDTNPTKATPEDVSAWLLDDHGRLQYCRIQESYRKEIERLLEEFSFAYHDLSIDGVWAVATTRRGTEEINGFEIRSHDRILALKCGWLGERRTDGPFAKPTRDLIKHFRNLITVIEREHPEKAAVVEGIRKQLAAVNASE